VVCPLVAGIQQHFLPRQSLNVCTRVAFKTRNLTHGLVVAAAHVQLLKGVKAHAVQLPDCELTVCARADAGGDNINGQVFLARQVVQLLDLKVWHRAAFIVVRVVQQSGINVKDNDFLDHQSTTSQGWGYVAFGKVISGMDVVNRIKATPTGPGGPFPTDVPQTPVVIQSATLVK
jgi:cyclophilin family peptidyl-prolyl cis-trans isomerase